MLDVRHIEQAVYFFTGFVYAKLRDRAWAVVSGGQAAVPVEARIVGVAVLFLISP